MGFKKFITPNLLKIILTIIFLVAINLFAMWSWHNIECPVIDGMPSPCMPPPPNYFGISLFFLIPSYLVSCIIVWLIEKIKSRK